MLSPAAQQVCWRLLAETSEGAPRDVFAMLDGARIKLLPDFAEAAEAEHACLFAGETDPMVLTRAPYLVRVPVDSETARWLLQDGWGKDWGVFAMTRPGVDFDIVLRDVRELLQARLPDGRIVFFRFYDPRVWRTFFETCDPAQLRLLFGRAVLAFGCEAAGGEGLWIDMMKDGQPERKLHLFAHD